MIREVIVVEGKDDQAAVKKAVDAEVIITNGLGIQEETIERIANAQRRTGVIILTDPDFPGEKIRKLISQRVPGCKHAYLPRKHGRKGQDIGVENARPEHIIQALSKVKTEGEVGENFYHGAYVGCRSGTGGLCKAAKGKNGGTVGGWLWKCQAIPKTVEPLRYYHGRISRCLKGDRGAIHR